MRKRACALDLGRSRVGVAIEDELGMLAHPRPYLDGKDRKAFLRDLRSFIREEEVTELVIGLPVDMSGEERVSAANVRVWAQEISDATGLDVHLWDERWTTKAASRGLRAGGTKAKDQRSKIDSASAVLILQAFLDRRGIE